MEPQLLLGDIRVLTRDLRAAEVSTMIEVVSFQMFCAPGSFSSSLLSLFTAIVSKDDILVNC
jgi:hypothetical protein